jgi:hypothetical protein
VRTVVEIEAAIELLPAAEQAKLRDLLLQQTGRVTNVEPLPDRIARKIYSQADDDVDAIQLFMAGQAKSTEE